MAVHGEWLRQNIPLQKLNSICRQQGYPHQASRGWWVLAAQWAGVAFLRATFWTEVQKEKVQRQICFKIVLYFRKKRGKATTLVDFSLNIPNICLHWTWSQSSWGSWRGGDFSLALLDFHMDGEARPALSICKQNRVLRKPLVTTVRWKGLCLPTGKALSDYYEFYSLVNSQLSARVVEIFGI